MKKKISIITPIYNGEKYIEKLIKRIREQDINYDLELIALVTSSRDNSLEEAKKYFDQVIEIKNFNHGKTRHVGTLKSKGDILVFITQDILPYDNEWLKNLIKPLNNNIIASFSRHIAYAEHSEIEKIIRKFNYPDKDRICNKETKEKNGRKNIFYSDASSAILRDKYFELGGYNFEVLTSEDVYLANKIVENGYTFIYSSQSRIWHSHELSLKKIYKRYKDIGKFEKLFEKEIDFSKTENEGKKLLKNLIKELLKNRKIKELIYLPFDMGVRWIGYKIGRKIK